MSAAIKEFIELFNRECDGDPDISQDDIIKAHRKCLIETTEKFDKITSIKEWLETYSLFYENKLILPYYYAPFQSNNDGTLSDPAIAEKFITLTKRGFIPVNSQRAEPYKQREYIIACVPTGYASRLCNKLNKYNGVVAFYQDFIDEDTIHGFFITYGQYNLYDSDEGKEKEGLMRGNGFTRIVGSFNDNISQLGLLMKNEMIKKINDETFKTINIVSALNDAPRTRILDILIEDVPQMIE